jgi:peptidoglycan/LPS O-acetylase OafA/YrhL
MSAQDDQIRPVMRWTALVVVVVLVPALVILWGLPGRTADLWAWTIKPDLTPIFMGAGYGAGAYFFARVFLGRRWHEGAIGILGAAVFALLMLVTTLIHYDKFNHGHGPTLAVIAFYGWVIVYVASPFLVGALWAFNQRTDPRVPEPGDPTVPRVIRLLARRAAVAALVVAAAVLVAPTIAIDSWGWKLTPLTARVLACFTAQVGVGFLMLSLDARWSSWRLLVQTFLLAVALLLVGAARASAAFDTGRPLTWAYLGGLVAGGLALAALYLTIERTGTAERPGVGPAAT